MYPGPITSYSGDLVVTRRVDEVCQANIVLKRWFTNGKWRSKQFGVYLDDTTPNLDFWVRLAVHEYGPLGQTVFVAVPTGRPDLHHRPCPPVVNLYEWYPLGEGTPESEFGLPPRYEGYIVQWNWPGVYGKTAPTGAQREKLLEQVRVHDPKFIFLY